MGKGLCISPGELRNYITIEAPTESRTANGGFSNSWATFANAWAGITVVSGNETQVTDKIEGKTLFIFTMRWLDAVVKTQRINWDGRIFNITEVKNVQERDRVLVIRTTEVDA